MAIRYDPLLTAGLARDIESRLLGRRVEEFLLCPDGREAWLRFAPESDMAPGSPADTSESASGVGSLGLMLHPEHGFAVHLPGEPRVGAGPLRRTTFRRLYLTSVGAPPDERLLVLDLAGRGAERGHGRPPAYRLFVELQTNQWNVILARGADERIEEVLWPRVAGERILHRGRSYTPPSGARDWASALPDSTRWEERLVASAPGERRRILLRSVAWTSSLNVDWILGDAAHSDDAGELSAALSRYRELRAAEPQAWLLPIGNRLQPYVAPIREGAVRCESLLEAMRTAAERADAWSQGEEDRPRAPAGAHEAGEARRLQHELRRRLRRLRRRGAALRRQLEGDPAAELRDLANLLLARKDEVPRGAASVSLTGFDGRDVQIELDPRLDAIRNAERLYDRASRRERAARKIPKRVRDTQRRIREIEAGLEALEKTGPSEVLWELAGGRKATAATSGGRGAPLQLPYRVFRSSSGREIRVGRSSRANDELTFHHASPEDIWLHARQAAGAHVILRWDRRDQNPPTGDLTEAAVLAALHSEARHSGMVAVDWTRRKYVRKPRKAPAGAVVPERVSTLFVEPDSTVAHRLTVEE